jgi:Tfp pilus assembly protein PilN
MIKINLLAERKQARAKPAPGLRAEGGGPSAGRNLLLVGILLLGVVGSGGWWWMLSGEVQDWQRKHADADRELKRLEEVRKKADRFKRQKDLLKRKIDLITELKKQQEVPVHIIDQVSRNLPDFLWLDSMTANKNQISINGKATNYTAVSNFYTNLSSSGYFKDVSLGRTFEVPEGVSFSLECRFAELGIGAGTGSETETGTQTEEQPKGRVG